MSAATCVPASHLHGFLRTYIDHSGPWPVAMVDGAESVDGLYQQRTDEWMAWVEKHEDEVHGHRCTGLCAFVAIAEVAASGAAPYEEENKHGT